MTITYDVSVEINKYGENDKEHHVLELIIKYDKSIRNGIINDGTTRSVIELIVEGEENAKTLLDFYRKCFATLLNKEKLECEISKRVMQIISECEFDTEETMLINQIENLTGLYSRSGSIKLNIPH